MRAATEPQTRPAYREHMIALPGGRGLEEGSMSAKAGTIQGTRTEVSWAGARIAAILLAVVLAVTLFATTRGASSSDTVPASTKSEVTQHLDGGGLGPRVASKTAPAQQPVMIGDFVCHQCR